ncbi:hypothetical protein H9N25_16805 [Pedobacter riviphilus]|uniref:Uncharacterized protein n=1 Tax=Pedobacter riviphilus TaxID=2766984 RepID=A0ABX6TDN1_9SPHI|nr:hypothetical protein [Pedobacter riviphilus]QNR83598.1 hypothetical protein H9N25_16805 [Pedobacter riviphilus]
MKSKPALFSIILLATVLISFKDKNEIKQCYISFKSASGLVAANPDRLPEGTEKYRTVSTANGGVNVTRTDGYRILYNNDKKAPFVNLKVELSEEKSYNLDKKKLLENLIFLASHTTGMESKNLIELKFNGYTVYGINRATIETGNILGTFILFPGNNTTIYFYFNNMELEYRNFTSLSDYKKQRDRFINEYTKYLNTCKGK